jgi:predicted nuclease with RNAse H fold
MVTLGIDLSSQPANTAASLIDWANGSAIARPPRLRCTDGDLSQLIDSAEAIGIDAPFGWPTEFVAAVNDWPHDTWSQEGRDRLRFRETDRFVRATQSVWPLSVSTDTIALPAMRAMSLLKKHRVTDRSGDGRFFEVYPAASLRAWGMTSRGYKEDKRPECCDARHRMLAALRVAMPWLVAPDDYARDPDALDSLIAALTARSASQGRTIRPDSSQVDVASREGWIHIPCGLPKP